MDAAAKSTEPTPPPPPQAASAAQISAVLGNDDILLRLDFPTCHVRAAAVSKRWLRHASDPAFLRRFARLHPPRLLGCFVNSSNFPLRFVPLPQPPELDAVIRRGRFDFGSGAANVSDCRNGRVIVFVMPDNGMPGEETVFSPLHPGRGTTVLPQPQEVSALPYGRYILGLDVASMSSICIKLPDGVEFECGANLALSRAEGSGFRLVHVLGHLADPSWTSRSAVVQVPAVGDNADFVFMRI
ncbi:hypothetical protein BAE44_0009707 [Dichanthelium oligosanthes]|uniref:F-box protein AT5G49610-like beta-propeller domain-containing protein n=1 Tax=Dichanthelium oligosanthes TaxID=888268 RepID=A0A1E5VVZ5_9POAL|nr:hypothetical protein BAE44_0009707 [Dichanthelium oligosanthes]